MIVYSVYISMKLMTKKLVFWWNELIFFKEARGGEYEVHEKLLNTFFSYYHAIRINNSGTLIE